MVNKKMNDNNELMMYIYKSCEMGVYSTRTLLNNLKNKENKIIHLLESELHEYEIFFDESKKILERSEEELRGSGILTKLGSNVGIMMETMKDNSDSAVASMLSEGFLMGVNEMNSKISKFKSMYFPYNIDFINMYEDIKSASITKQLVKKK